MSIEAMSAVFKMDLPPNHKWMMVVLADNAAPDGTCIFPAIATLGQKSGYGERNVQRLLRELERAGLIQPYEEPKNHYGTQAYRFTFMPMTEAPRPETRSCPPKLREQVIAAFGQTCVYCAGRGDAVYGPNGNKWHVDRLVPAKRGGTYAPENVTLSCSTCNVRKGTRRPAIDTPTLAELLDLVPPERGANLAPTPAKMAPPTPPAKMAPPGAKCDGGGVPPSAPEPSQLQPPEVLNLAPTRAKNPFFEALVEACGLVRPLSPAFERTVGVAGAELAKLGATPEEIVRRASNWSFSMHLTPMGLVKNWGLLAAPPRPRRRDPARERFEREMAERDQLARERFRDQSDLPSARDVAGLVG